MILPSTSLPVESDKGLTFPKHPHPHPPPPGLPRAVSAVSVAQLPQVDGETVRLKLGGKGSLVGEGSFADVIRGTLTIRGHKARQATGHTRSEIVSCAAMVVIVQ